MAKQQAVTTTVHTSSTISSVFRGVIATLVCFGGMELLIARPSSIRWVLFVLSGVVFVVTVSHGARTWRTASDRRLLFVTLLLTVMSVLFLLFPAGRLVQHGVAAALSVWIGVSVFQLRSSVHPETSGTRYTFFEASLFLAVFLVYVTSMNAILFFSSMGPQWSNAALLGSISLTTLVFGYQFFATQGIPRARTWMYTACLGLLLAQVAWGLTFWPTDGFSRGAVLFIVFYVLAGLAKHAFRRSFSWRVFGEYAVTSSLVLAALLATTQWIF